MLVSEWRACKKCLEAQQIPLVYQMQYISSSIKTANFLSLSQLQISRAYCIIETFVLNKTDLLSLSMKKICFASLYLCFLMQSFLFILAMQ